MEYNTPRTPEEIINYYYWKLRKENCGGDKYDTASQAFFWSRAIIHYLNERAKINNDESNIMLGWEMNSNKDYEEELKRLELLNKPLN